MDDLAAEDQTRAGIIPAKIRRSKTKLYLIPLALIGLLAAWNAPVTVPVVQALSGETDASVFVHRAYFLSPSEIVFDLRSITADSSMASVDRKLFKAAEALKDQDYDAVILAYRGTRRFRIPGSHFKQIGQEFAWQNPIYLVRTLTENIENLDGTSAFATWTGGLIGVLRAQMEDHNRFHEQWYLEGELARLSR